MERSSRTARHSERDELDLSRACAAYALISALEIDSVDLFRALDRAPSPLVLDARTPFARRCGRIPGSLPVESVDELSPGCEDVVVFGANDRRLDAIRAAADLTRRGIRARLLRGGFDGWVAEGFPIERDMRVRLAPAI